MDAPGIKNTAEAWFIKKGNDRYDWVNGKEVKQEPHQIEAANNKKRESCVKFELGPEDTAVIELKLDDGRVFWSQLKLDA